MAVCGWQNAADGSVSMWQTAAGGGSQCGVPRPTVSIRQLNTKQSEKRERHGTAKGWLATTLQKMTCEKATNDEVCSTKDGRTR